MFKDAHHSDSYNSKKLDNFTSNNRKWSKSSYLGSTLYEHRKWNLDLPWTNYLVFSLRNLEFSSNYLMVCYEDSVQYVYTEPGSLQATINGLPRWPGGKESACHAGD